MADMTVEEAIALADNWLTSGGDPGIGMIALKTLRNEVRKRQWVPVTERLPEFNEPVALLNMRRMENCEHERYIQDAGYLSNAAGPAYWAIRGERAALLDYYTHWSYMPPLPAPPGGE